MKDFRELKVWHKAHQLTLAVYEASGGFRREELYGLTRCAVRVPRFRPTWRKAAAAAVTPSWRDSARWRWDRRASWNTYCCWPRDLRLVEPKPYAELAEATTEVKRMLAALLQKLIADR